MWLAVEDIATVYISCSFRIVQAKILKSIVCNYVYDVHVHVSVHVYVQIKVYSYVKV